MEQLPGLSEDEIRAAVADLRNQGYLAVIYSDNTFTVMLNSKAHGYFREKEERVAIERTKRNEERSWNLKMMGISYSLGLISGVILMWIKAKVFL
jgi:DNA-binding transcriptional regulator PaaX